MISERGDFPPVLTRKAGITLQGYNKWFPYGTKMDQAGIGKLFCFHHAGGNASAFRSWALSKLPVAFIPVELPGHGRRIAESYAEDMDVLAEDIAEAIYRQWEGEPIGLFGHSMGSVVAFKTTWILEQKYHLFPELLVAAGRHAPPLPDPVTFRSDMDDDALVEELIRMGGTPKEILENREFLNFLLPTIRGDYRLHENFRYHDEMIKTPIVAHTGLEDHDAPESLVQPWAKMTTGDFFYQEFPGDHFFLYDAENHYPSELVHLFHRYASGKSRPLSPNKEMA